MDPSSSFEDEADPELTEAQYEAWPFTDDGDETESEPEFYDPNGPARDVPVCLLDDFVFFKENDAGEREPCQLPDVAELADVRVRAMGRVLPRLVSGDEDEDGDEDDEDEDTKDGQDKEQGTSDDQLGTRVLLGLIRKIDLDYTDVEGCVLLPYTMSLQLITELQQGMGPHAPGLVCPRPALAAIQAVIPRVLQALAHYAAHHRIRGGGTPGRLRYIPERCLLRSVGRNFRQEPRVRGYRGNRI